MLKYLIKIVKFIIKSIVFVCFLVIMLFLTAKNIPQLHVYTERIETKIEKRFNVSINKTWNTTYDVFKIFRRIERHGFPLKEN